VDSPRIVDDLWDSADCGDSTDRGTAQMHRGMVQIHCGTLVDAQWDSKGIVDTLWDGADSLWIVRGLWMTCGIVQIVGTAQMHSGMVQIHCGILADALWELHEWMHCGIVRIVNAL